MKKLFILLISTVNRVDRIMHDAYYTQKDKKEPATNSEFIQIRYTDLLGKFLAKYVQTDKEHIHDIFRTGVALDGSSVKGFATIDESDMMLIPDRQTLRKIPLSEFDINAVIADVYNGFNGGRSLQDPRYVSQALEDHLAVNQISCQVGAEVECFIFDQIVFDIYNENNIADSDTKPNDNHQLAKIRNHTFY